MAYQTAIEIQSAAAQLCGQAKYNSVADGGAFALSAAEFYEQLVESELGNNKWHFALKNEAVSIVNTLTPSFEGWLYYWDLPANILMFHRVDPGIEYNIFGERLVTKSNQPFTVTYSVNVPVSKWPPPFKMYMVYNLASMLAISVTLSDQMVNRVDKGLQIWSAKARFADSQAQSQRPIKSRPYIYARQ